MLVISLIILILLLVLLKWLWHNLGNINSVKKIIYIIIGIAIVFAYTFIIYIISKKGIQYESENVMRYIQTILVLLFAVVNGYIILPFIFNIIEKIENDDIEKRIFQKRVIIFFIIIVVLTFIEISYFKSTQKGILSIMEKSYNSQQ